MARPTKMTPAFVTKAVAELKKPNATIHTVGRKLGCSPNTVQRATGGKRMAEMGRKSAYLAQIEKNKAKREAAANRRSASKVRKAARAAKPVTKARRRKAA